MDVVRFRARLVAGLGSFVTLFVLMLAVDAAQTVPTGNIAGHWPLDTITTTTADVSGNSNTATLVSTPTSAAGLFGNGLTFASGKYLTVPSSATLDVASGSFTVAAWIKPTATTVQRIINKYNGTTGFQFDINAAVGGSTNTAGNLRFILKGNVTHDLSVAGTLGTGGWKHIAATVDRASTQKMLRLYVDGVQKGTKDITTLTSSLTNTSALLIGSYASAGYYTGIMDEPIVYTRLLSAAEIKTLSGVPQNPTATTNQVGKVTLGWTAVPGAASYRVSRSSTSGGPYTLLASPTTASYVDNAGAGTYYYVIQAVFTGNGGFTSQISAQVTGTALPPEVTALPNTGLQTNENGASTSFTIQFNQVAPGSAQSLVVVSSSAILEGVVSSTYTGVPGSYTATATGFQVAVPANTTPTFTVTVTGVDDVFADGPKPFTVNVSASGFTALTIPPVQVTNNDNDTAGVTISKTSGLVTSEAGGNDTFTVSLNTKPVGTITMPLSSTLTSEGTLSAGSVTFTPTNWNTAQQVTVMGVDDAVLDFSVPYAIVTGALTTTSASDSAYTGMNPADVQAANLDDEVIPDLDPVWGDDSGGGCGLTGLEAVLALALALLARRRR